MINKHQYHKRTGASKTREIPKGTIQEQIEFCEAGIRVRTKMIQIAEGWIENKGMEYGEAHTRQQRRLIARCKRLIRVYTHFIRQHKDTYNFDPKNMNCA